MGPTTTKATLNPATRAVHMGPTTTTVTLNPTTRAVHTKAATQSANLDLADLLDMLGHKEHQACPDSTEHQV